MEKIFIEGKKDILEWAWKLKDQLFHGFDAVENFPSIAWFICHGISLLFPPHPPFFGQNSPLRSYGFAAFNTFTERMYHDTFSMTIEKLWTICFLLKCSFIQFSFFCFSIKYQMRLNVNFIWGNVSFDWFDGKFIIFPRWFCAMHQSSDRLELRPDWCQLEVR